MPTSISPSDHTGERRGRKSSRFSFSSVSNVFMDAMKDHVQPKPSHVTVSQEGLLNDGERGRKLYIKKGKGRQSASLQKERFSIGKLGDLLKLEGDENKEFGDGWKEFKKGVMRVFLSCCTCRLPYHSRHLHLPHRLRYPRKFASNPFMSFWLRILVSQSRSSPTWRFHSKTTVTS
jgi:hypothetical protein